MPRAGTIKSMPLPVIRPEPQPDRWLAFHAPLAAWWLTEFLRDEAGRKRGMGRAVIGVSGGVDSAVSAALAVRAFGPKNVFGFLMPYRISSADSLAHGHLVCESLGIEGRVIEITGMVDGYLGQEPDAAPARIGNVCSRCRANILFDQSAKLGALPIGTGNKTERLMGYYTWHGDDSPPLNPLGDLYKTQVWSLARELALPEEVVAKAPTADLVAGQTDEGDLGISYPRADAILARSLGGLSPQAIERDGYSEAEIRLVLGKVARTHWKRHLPTSALLTDTSINDYYLRPVDYFVIANRRR